MNADRSRTHCTSEGTFVKEGQNIQVMKQDVIPAYFIESMVLSYRKIGLQSLHEYTATHQRATSRRKAVFIDFILLITLLTPDPTLDIQRSRTDQGDIS
jgi:hypothetical protein